MANRNVGLAKTAHDSSMTMESRLNVAEGGGFEPPIGALDSYNGLANRRLQPLGHPSAGEPPLFPPGLVKSLPL